MKLLFDHNLSPRLVTQLAALFVGSAHLTHHALEKATDVEVWRFARDNGFTLVTKDSDFHDLSLLRGSPPQVVWLRVGNCTTANIEKLLRQHQPEIEQFILEATAGVLVLQYLVDSRCSRGVCARAWSSATTSRIARPK